jgi:O-antigen/teichoic acid export membrane protein
MASMIIGLIINPFLALGLSHTDYAIIGYFASFSLILTPLIGFKFQSYYARNFFLVSEQKREKMLQTLLSLMVTFGLAVFLLFFIGYYFYHKNYVSEIPFFPFALLSFLPIYFSSFYNIYLLDLRMKNNAKKYAIISCLNSIIAAILSIFLVVIFKYGAKGRLLSLLLVAIVLCLYSIKAQKFHFEFDKEIVREAFSFCWPLTISGILTFFFMGIDRTFLAELNDVHTFGLYNVGLQISSYLAVFGTVLLNTFDPDLFKYTSLNLHRKVIYLTVFLVVISLIPNLIFILFSKPIISLLTSGRYTDAAHFANILCLKNITSVFAFIMSDVIIGYGYARYELVNRIIGSVLAIIIYKYLIGYWGFYGAAWGQALSWVAMAGISCVFLLIFRRKRI